MYISNETTYFHCLILIENLFSATSEANVYLDKKDHGLTQKTAKKTSNPFESTFPRKYEIFWWLNLFVILFHATLFLRRNFSQFFTANLQILEAYYQQDKYFVFFSSIQTTQSLVEIWRRTDARSWKGDGGPVIWCQKYSNNCYHGLSSSNTKNSYATHTFCFVDLSISRWGDFDWP